MFKWTCKVLGHVWGPNDEGAGSKCRRCDKIDTARAPKA